MTNQPHDRRRFSRVRIDIEADIQDGSLSALACRTRDLSLQGVFVITDVPFATGATCEVALVLQGTVDPIRLKMKGHVVRREADGLAFLFDCMEGLDCMRHLSNLVRYNSPDPDKIMEEEEELLEVFRSRNPVTDN